MSSSFLSQADSNLLGTPHAIFDSTRNTIAHLYQNIVIAPDALQNQVENYLRRKQSYSSHVACVDRIIDEKIIIQNGKVGIRVSLVTDFVPWRLEQSKEALGRDEALFLLAGACKGFRELLHRVRVPFQVEAFMIGVNDAGVVKVWWNNDFSKSKFGMMMENVKLNCMIGSIVKNVTLRMGGNEGKHLEKDLDGYTETFVALESRLEELSRGMNLGAVGVSIISKNPNIKEVFSTLNKQNPLPSNTPIKNDLITLSPSKPKEYPLNLSNVKTERHSEDTSKIITKRIYRDGTSPSFHEKINIIKTDIENLRSVVEKKEVRQAQQNPLRASRSVQNIFTFEKSIMIEAKSPQQWRNIRSSEVIAPAEDLKISRFINPQSSSNLSPSKECEACKGVNLLRQSQVSIQNGLIQCQHLQSLLPRGTDKLTNSTQRSLSSSQLLRNHNSEFYLPRFGESEKKLPEKVYFTSLFEN